MIVPIDISIQYADHIWNIVQVSTNTAYAHGYLESVSTEGNCTVFTFTNGKTVEVEDGNHFVITSLSPQSM